MSSSVILHQLFTRVWVTGRVPSEWKEGSIVSLYKGTWARVAKTNAAVIDQYHCYLYQARYSLTFC